MKRRLGAVLVLPLLLVGCHHWFGAQILNDRPDDVQITLDGDSLRGSWRVPGLALAGGIGASAKFTGRVTIYALTNCELLLDAQVSSQELVGFMVPRSGRATVGEPVSGEMASSQQMTPLCQAGAQSASDQ